MNDAANAGPSGVIASIVNKFLTSHLAIVLIILAISIGIAAVLVTPREEEPQIIVPMADVYVQSPGASAEEVEKEVDCQSFMLPSSRKNLPPRMAIS